MEGMGMCEMDTRAGPSFPEGLGTDDSVPRLILSNDLLYKLYYFK